MPNFESPSQSGDKEKKPNGGKKETPKIIVPGETGGKKETPKIIVPEEIGEKRTPEQVREFQEIREKAGKIMETKRKEAMGRLLTDKEIRRLGLEKRYQEAIAAEEKAKKQGAEQREEQRREEERKQREKEKRKKEEAEGKLNVLWEEIKARIKSSEGETKEGKAEGKAIDAVCKAAEDPVKNLTGGSLRERARDNAKFEVELRGGQVLTYEQWMDKGRIEREKIRMRNEGIIKAWEAQTQTGKAWNEAIIEDWRKALSKGEKRGIREFARERLEEERQRLEEARTALEKKLGFSISEDVFYNFSRKGYDVENIEIEGKGFFRGKKEIVIKSREEGKEPFRILIDKWGEYEEGQKGEIRKEAKERREESFKIGRRKWEERLRGHKVRIIESLAGEEGGIKVDGKKFSFWSEVIVKRTSGKIEGGWKISGFTEKGDVIVVKTEEETGRRLMKKVSREHFIEWQKGEGAQAEKKTEGEEGKETPPEKVPSKEGHGGADEEKGEEGPEEAPKEGPKKALEEAPEPEDKHKKYYETAEGKDPGELFERLKDDAEKAVKNLTPEQIKQLIETLKGAIEKGVTPKEQKESRKKLNDFFERHQVLGGFKEIIGGTGKVIRGTARAIWNVLLVLLTLFNEGMEGIDKIRKRKRQS